MTPSFRAAKDFLTYYDNEVRKMRPYRLKPVLLPPLNAWWEENKHLHPRATFVLIQESVEATMAYNLANPNR
jgi:hypothetical protein